VAEEAAVGEQIVRPFSAGDHRVDQPVDRTPEFDRREQDRQAEQQGEGGENGEQAAAHESILL
jgi:hypothetical protein